MRKTNTIMLTAIVAFVGLTPAATAVEKASAEKTGSVVGSLAFQLGLRNRVDFDGKGGDANTTLAITPALEKKLGEVVGAGAEWMFVWMGADNLDERRLILSPHARLGMRFPVYDRVTFDGMLGIGPSIWTSVDKVPDELGGGTRFGWSIRFAFGGAYAFNKHVAAFGDLGYYSTTTYGDDVEINLNMVLTSVGLRSSF